jgi:competence ComEA-like helix-hairpin-helix protein
VARRTELFALAVIVCGLALNALARLPREPAQARQAPHAARARASAPASDVALRALRRDEPLDLNRAGAADLELLPGVGPALAQRIVSYRATHGAFASIDALAQVRGIGPKTLARLRPLLSIASTAAPARAAPASDRAPRSPTR